MDFFETYAPVTCVGSFRILFHLCAQLDCEMVQLDVKIVFLQNLHQEGMAWKLLKSIYGLKQASHVFYQHLLSHMKKLGYSALFADSCIFVCTSLDLKHTSIVGVHVDNMVLISNCVGESKRAQGEIKDEFPIGAVSEPTLILGMSIERDRKRRVIYVSQKHYLKNILERFEMQDCNPATTTYTLPVELLYTQLFCPYIAGFST